MPPLLPPIVLLVIVVGSVILLILIRRTIIKRRQRAKDLMNRATCQRCGYDLRGLEVPRCPECGALRGFTKTAAEMGIEEEIDL